MQPINASWMTKYHTVTFAVAARVCKSPMLSAGISANLGLEWPEEVELREDGVFVGVVHSRSFGSHHLFVLDGNNAHIHPPVDGVASLDVSSDKAQDRAAELMRKYGELPALFFSQAAQEAFTAQFGERYQDARWCAAQAGFALVVHPSDHKVHIELPDGTFKGYAEIANAMRDIARVSHVWNPC